MTQTVGWVVTKSYASGSVEFLILKEDQISWTWVPNQATILREMEKGKDIISQLKNNKEIELLRVEISY